MDYQAFASSLNSRQLIPVTDSILDLVKKNPTKDTYASLYTYRDHHVEQFKKTDSLSGIKDVTTSRLFFDFDDALAVNNAQADTLEVCNRLIESGVPVDNIQIWFSGNKGFHLDIPIKQNLDRQEFINIVFNLAADRKTFDVRINDEARIIRNPLSRHPKSGLYKIPLTLQELQTLKIDEIKKSAKDIDGFDFNEFKNIKPIELPEALDVLKYITFKKVASLVPTDIKGFDVKDIDFSHCPKWLPRERYALQEGFFYGTDSVQQGERNISFLILCATFKNQGFSQEHTKALLEVTAEKQAARTGEDPYTSEQLQREIINVVYSPNWKGGIYSKDEPILQLTRQRFDITEFEVVDNKALIKIEDVGGRFKSFASSFHENRILTGIDSLDKKLVLTTGMAVGLLGAPSSGKTTLLNKIVKYQSHKNIPCVYQSLDMSDNLLYLRMLQQHLKLPIEKILDGFQQDEPPKELMDAYNSVLKSYSNVHFNFRSAMTVEQIDKDIRKYKLDTQLNPKFIAIDYLEKIRSSFTDPTASSGIIASQLSDLAKEHDAAVMVLLQPQKSAGAPDQPLLSMRKVKGASVIEQDLRVILTCWRPGFNPQDPSTDKYMSLAVVKNNLGELCQLDYEWSGINGEIRELDVNGRSSLKSLLADLAAKATEEQKEWI
jgi:replicative DNA helicase